MFANTLAKPIQRLTEATKNISLGKNLDERVADTDREDEIGLLFGQKVQPGKRCHTFP